jgi:hypothetical protein
MRESERRFMENRCRFRSYLKWRTTTDACNNSRPIICYVDP